MGGLCPPPPVVDDTPPSSADTELDERPEAVLPRPAPTPDQGADDRGHHSSCRPDDAGRDQLVPMPDRELPVPLLRLLAISP